MCESFAATDTRLPPLERARLGASGSAFVGHQVHGLYHLLFAEAGPVTINRARFRSDEPRIHVMTRIAGILGDLEMAIRRELGADQIPPKVRTFGRHYYPQVTLSDGWRTRRVPCTSGQAGVHRAISRPSGPSPRRHPQRGALSNLNYGTRKDNQRDRKRTGRRGRGKRKRKRREKQLDRRGFTGPLSCLTPLHFTLDFTGALQVQADCDKLLLKGHLGILVKDGP